MGQNKPSSIVITGASSGIGEALALYYAGPGVMLGLTGRNPERLQEVARRCKDKGAEVNAAVLDVADQQKMAQWLKDFDAQRSVDLLIANAGISGVTTDSVDVEVFEKTRAVFEVNIMGVLNTIEPILPHMIARRSGQIAIMSSLAGFRGWSRAPAYCASKAAVKVYGEALHDSLRRMGIKVNVICPGFVHSRITEKNEFPMPFLMDTDRAVKIIVRGLKNNKSRIAFPFTMFFLVWLVTVIPDCIIQKILCIAPSKNVQK